MDIELNVALVSTSRSLLLVVPQKNINFKHLKLIEFIIIKSITIFGVAEIFRFCFIFLMQN